MCLKGTTFLVNLKMLEVRAERSNSVCWPARLIWTFIGLRSQNSLQQQLCFFQNISALIWYSESIWNFNFPSLTSHHKLYSFFYTLTILIFKIKNLVVNIKLCVQTKKIKCLKSSWIYRIPCLTSHHKLYSFF